MAPQRPRPLHVETRPPDFAPPPQLRRYVRTACLTLAWASGTGSAEARPPVAPGPALLATALRPRRASRPRPGFRGGTEELAGPASPRRRGFRPGGALVLDEVVRASCVGFLLSPPAPRCAGRRGGTAGVAGHQPC
ncbi:uncharacterized protein LOC128929223 isoform X2 [Callithrix jacchus]